MDLREALDERERLLRTLLIVGLSAVAISSIWKGRRLNGLLAGGGALLLGYVSTTESEDLTEMVDTDLSEAVDTDLSEAVDTDLTETLGSDDEDGRLRCAACGEPIETGQPRVPNEDDEIIHRDCE